MGISIGSGVAIGIGPPGTIGVNLTTLQYLVVGGGGGGGAFGGGGGGGGGVLTGNLQSSLSVPYTITVGAGGAGATQNNPAVTATSGSNSNISGASITTIINASGGGGGGTGDVNASASSTVGASGGSGGGGGGRTAKAGGAGTNYPGPTQQGSPGGASMAPDTPGVYAGGGGGGASALGTQGASGQAGAGGAGYTWTYTGTTYAGGGGGGAYAGSGGAGGPGGGGPGAGGAVNGTAGTAGLGGGGGAGGGAAPGLGTGGLGGNGIVAIAYQGSSQLFTGGTVTPGAANPAAPGYFVHTFTNPGTTTMSVASLDPYFNNTPLLVSSLTMSANAAQNNTFIDSSTNNFTITRGGTPTQGSFAPLGTLWSNYFNGSTDYLSVATSSSFAFPGDFTVEFWVNPTSFNQYGCMLDTRTVNSNATGFYIRSQSVFSSGQWQVSNGTASFTINASTNLTANTWQHIALVRSGTTLTLYLNGFSVGSATVAQNFSDGGLRIFNAIDNYYFPGYISNLRLVKGTAVYTAAFTPPTAPLTAITNTTLLTSQSNRFKDNSTNNFTITRTGTPSVQTYNPFLPTSAYATAAQGASMYFNGSNDYLTAPANAAFSFGTGDFTVEAWYNMPPFTNTNGKVMFDSRPTSTNGPYWVAGVNSSTGYPNFTTMTSGGVTVTGNVSIADNTWHHCAVTRQSGTILMFVDGQIVGSATGNSDNISSSGLGIGILAFASGAPDTYYNGYMSNARIVKGTAVYTAAFTPPLLPLGATQSANVNGNPSAAITGTQTSLLLSGANAGIADSTGVNNITTLGSAAVNTSVVKYGLGSVAFNGTTSYLYMPSNPSLTFGSGNWTIEMWLYASALPTNPATAQLYDTRPASTNGAYTLIYLNSDGTIRLWVSSADRITSSAISTGQWYHVAVSRSNGSTKMFINGTQTGSTYTDSTVYLGGNLRVGASFSGGASISNYLNGYIQDLRVTNGIARYTTTFTPPTSALPTFSQPGLRDSAYTVQYLVVAGGGGGAGGDSGGGGGGGMLAGSVGLTVNSSYTINVGARGSGTQIGGSSGNGFSSNISGPGITTVSATGGGGGGGYNTAAAPGGSGGGGSNATGGAGGTGVPGQGFPGGGPLYGGGGGAGGAGSSQLSYGSGASGGPGAVWPYTGLTYAGGGGAGMGGGAVPGGGGGPGSAGTNGLGGGGGGTRFTGDTGAPGGSGTVILAVPTLNFPGNAPGAAISTPPAAPGMTVLTYTTPSPTASATFTYTG